MPTHVLHSIRSSFSVLAACLILAGSASADTVTLVPTRDNTLISPDGTYSNGIGPGLFCGRTMERIGLTLRGVVHFDAAAALPAGATVTSASLRMQLIMGSPNSGLQPVSLHRVLANWGEGTSLGFGGSGAESTFGDATWLHSFFPTQFWTNPGGDFDPAPLASQDTDWFGAPVTWTSTAAMVSTVQSWVTTPASNFGFMLMGSEENWGTARQFASREYDTDPTYVPMLTIDFTPAIPPCPGDWNHDGMLTSQDFFDFITAFFSNNADFNHDNMTTSQDFFDFIAAFFTGC